MSWSDYQDQANAAVQAVMGAACTYQHSRTGVVDSLNSVIIYEPRVVDEFAFDIRPLAEIDANDMTSGPEQGDQILDADGVRWYVDTWDILDGVYRITVRGDTQ